MHKSTATVRPGAVERLEKIIPAVRGPSTVVVELPERSAAMLRYLCSAVQGNSSETLQIAESVARALEAAGVPRGYQSESNAMAAVGGDVRLVF